MGIRMEQSKKTSGTVLCVAVLLLLFIMLCVRAPYGFDLTDEPYYSVLPYRLVLGDRILVDMWEVHQLSGLVVLPFLRGFLLITGGDMTGVMLYFRYVLIVVQMLVALYAYFVLRRKSGQIAALLVAGFTLMHAHYGLNGFSYNMLGPLLVLLTALTCFDALDGTRMPLKMVLSGACYALSVLVYPYFIISLPVWIVFWPVLLKKHRAERGFMRTLCWWFAGLAAVTALFLTYVLVKSSGADLLANLRGIISDPDHERVNALRVLGSYANATRVLFGPVFLGAVALLVWGVITCFVKNMERQRLFRRMGFLGAAALLAAAVVWLITYDYPDFHKINLTAMTIALVAPGLYFLTGRKGNRAILLFFLGCALSIAVQLGSNTRIRASSGALLPASLGAALYLFDGARMLQMNDKQSRVFRALATVACAALLMITAGLRLTSVYRDEPLPFLNKTISTGPAKGIITTEKRAGQYEILRTEIMENAPESGHILITRLMPIGYLFTGLSPATPSTFGMTMDSQWLSMYLAQHPERTPDYIFAVGTDYGVSNELALEGVAQYKNDPAYETRSILGGTVLIRTAD
ncbi:MAG: hypothetical protein RRZ24_05295 [Clostridia bacterium]